MYKLRLICHWNQYDINHLSYHSLWCYSYTTALKKIDFGATTTGLSRRFETLHLSRNETDFIIADIYYPALQM